MRCLFVEPDIKDAAIEDAFEPLIAELRQGGDAAQRAARWLLQAAPRWHERVRGTGSAWASLIAASAVLEGRQLIQGAPPKQVSGAQLARALPPTVSGTKKLGLVRTQDGLRFVGADVPEVTTIDVPAYSPLLLLLEIPNEPPLVIDVKPDLEVPLRIAGPVTLRSLIGDAWSIEYLAPDILKQPRNVEESNQQQESEQAPADDEVVTGAEETVAQVKGESRRVVVIVGGKRRDAFNAIADRLHREKYQPVMPEFFMGDSKALPAIRNLLSTARFVVMDAGLPRKWLDAWFTAFREQPQIPVVTILHETDKMTEYSELYTLPSLVPQTVLFKDANDLARVAIQRVIEPAEQTRQRLLAEQTATRKRLRVFLSSTVSDLGRYREAVRDALRPSHDLIMIEDFSAKTATGVRDHVRRN